MAALTEQASIAGVPFRLRPQSVKWDFTARTSVTETIGGKVVQVLGVEMGPMTVQGSFGAGGWEEQDAFLAKMRYIAQSQINNFTAEPQRFIMPTRGWDFGVFLTNYSPSTLDSSTVNLRWTLNLTIVDNNANLRGVAESVFIARLAKGLGWEINRYNGGMDVSDIEAYLAQTGFSDAVDAFEQAYGEQPGRLGVGATGNPNQAVGVDGGTSR